MKQQNDCPDLETIGAYLDRRLGGTERARVGEHLAGCERCYFIFSAAAQVKPVGRVERIGWREALVRPVVMWPSAGALAAATAWLIIAGSFVPSRSTESAAYAALVAAVGDERPFEARLTGGFAYGTVRSARRTRAPSTFVASPDVRIAAALVEKEATAQRTTQSLNALGVAYLVMDDVSHAVSVLEEAANQPTPDPRVLSDLSAAYIVRGTRSNQPQHFASALAVADRAVGLDGGLAEARFNRAYVLERMSRTDEARRAWEDYLRMDDKSGWAEEARNHLKSLPGTSVR